MLGPPSLAPLPYDIVVFVQISCVEYGVGVMVFGGQISLAGITNWRHSSPILGRVVGHEAVSFMH